MKVRIKDPKKGRRFTPNERAELVRRFKQRTETAAEFARSHQVALCTLHRWIQQGGRLKKKARGSRPVFQELPMVAGMATWTTELRLTDGTLLRWNPGTDVAALTDVLNHLRPPC